MLTALFVSSTGDAARIAAYLILPHTGQLRRYIVSRQRIYSFGLMCQRRGSTAGDLATVNFGMR
jgi:hypothetical protein